MNLRMMKVISSDHSEDLSEIVLQIEKMIHTGRPLVYVLILSATYRRIAFVLARFTCTGKPCHHTYRIGDQI